MISDSEKLLGKDEAIKLKVDPNNGVGIFRIPQFQAKHKHESVWKHV